MTPKLTANHEKTFNKMEHSSSCFQTRWVYISIGAQKVANAIKSIFAAISKTFGWQNNAKIQRPDSNVTAKFPMNTIVLSRDSDGFYTLPHFEVPGFTNMGTVKARELNLCFGNFLIDTANGIVPAGWILER